MRRKNKRTFVRTNRGIGALGESIAEKYLVSRGYRIIESNYVTFFGEIDLIAKKDGSIIFIEVKTRTSRKYGSPLYAITPYKQRTIIANSLAYLKRWGSDNAPARIDIIAIDLNDNGELLVLEHVKNAVMPNP